VSQVILDEFEKLDPDAQMGFLEAWASGQWVDTSTSKDDVLQTRKVDCSKTIFILTTNAKLEPVDTKLRYTLKKKLPFPFELNGRMTDVFVYPRFEEGCVELGNWEDHAGTCMEYRLNC
jgi:ATP-dependent Clp protease ATP-binding subunit ClpA